MVISSPFMVSASAADEAVLSARRWGAGPVRNWRSRPSQRDWSNRSARPLSPRWLAKDAIKPWQHRSWIFPRDPAFETKAARALELYARIWEVEPLVPDDYVISADEKSQLQALRRRHPGLWTPFQSSTR